MHSGGRHRDPRAPARTDPACRPLVPPAGLADPPQVWILADELALYRLVGSPEVMTLQLAHVMDVARLPHVTAHVVPAEGHAATGAGMIITPDAAYTDHLAGGYVYVEDESATLTRMITDLQANAYRASESLEIMERVRGQWTSGNPLTALRKAGRASK